MKRTYEVDDQVVVLLSPSPWEHVAVVRTIRGSRRLLPTSRCIVLVKSALETVDVPATNALWSIAVLDLDR